MKMKNWTILCGAAALTLIVSCGKKEAPVPAAEPTPAPVVEIEVEVPAEEVTVDTTVATDPSVEVEATEAVTTQPAN